SPGEQSTPQPTAPNPELGHETTHVATEELKTGSLADHDLGVLVAPPGMPSTSSSLKVPPCGGRSLTGSRAAATTT
ncbi:MAG TPA: hypothetical protein VK586_17585, partial [Streptosporangiaceae bacterium]|nr:hypothetical protein [Streptosporangiaceae bacterium]